MGLRCPPPVLPPIDEQRWQLPQPLQALGVEQPAALAQASGLPEELIAVLLRRGHRSSGAIAALLKPPAPPPAEQHFSDLHRAVERLKQACSSREALAICGDYDADGMTSTALLVGVLQRLGARPVAAIPSRMDDGYGLNTAMVERLAAEGIRLLITVDNGVSASAALERAEQLGVAVILTDHHTLPPQLPPHLALLHPAVTPENSPYRGLAGVGLAYVLARALCESVKAHEGLAIALNLFCIGTIADMAPLQGVNRAWLRLGLPQLAASPLPGLQALLQLAGVEPCMVGAQTVGFQLAPRINAVGRLGDPALVVDLLTTDEPQRALELARQCDQLNRQRRELCDAIEAEALALLEADGEQRSAFVLIAQNHWHHGVIGIVAARLVERFGRPVALAAGEGNGRLRASARAPRGFAIDQALQSCSALLERFGGHPAAGGFSVRAEHLSALHAQLNALAAEWLLVQGQGMPVEPEALLPLDRIDLDFWVAQQRLEPFGIGHPAPIYWSRRCQVLQQSRLRGGHLQLLLAQGATQIRAMGWRWQGGDTVPPWVDVAYRLVRDHWQGRDRLQLELVGLRASSEGQAPVVLCRQKRQYWCTQQGDMLVVRNADGQELRHPVAAIGSDLDGQLEDGQLEHPYVRSLLSEAAVALGLAA
ncbi:MAG: single-stranded-DNA-specific exonuclease RecJ [Cyanobacteriota bacterium]|nr:single-stranded-DNA-specific exonuclease RecJ [Cyanobacteriota bacterium]